MYLKISIMEFTTRGVRTSRTYAAWSTFDFTFSHFTTDAVSPPPTASKKRRLKSKYE